MMKFKRRRRMKCCRRWRRKGGDLQLGVLGMQLEEITSASDPPRAPPPTGALQSKASSTRASNASLVALKLS